MALLNHRETLFLAFLAQRVTLSSGDTVTGQLHWEPPLERFPRAWIAFAICPHHSPPAKNTERLIVASSLISLTTSVTVIGMNLVSGNNSISSQHFPAYPYSQKPLLERPFLAGWSSLRPLPPLSLSGPWGEGRRQGVCRFPAASFSWTLSGTVSEWPLRR